MPVEIQSTLIRVCTAGSSSECRKAFPHDIRALSGHSCCHRAVLVLRDIEQLDTKTTASILGESANVVRVRLHRARQALPTCLDPHFRSICSPPAN